MSMDASAVNALTSLVKQPVVHHEAGYSTRVFVPKANGEWTITSLAPSVVPVMEVTSLSAIREYLIANVDLLPVNELMLLASYDRVVLTSKLNSLDHIFQRHNYLSAVPHTTKFEFGRWTSMENFIIGIRTQFEQTPERDALVALLSGVSDNYVRQVSDDGVSQEVNVGRAVKSRATMPPVVKLRPFRTFREVEQVEGSFILRLKPSDDEAPLAALYDADENLWKQEATKRVCEWLRDARIDETHKVVVIG